jgi:hypothetical protein
MVFATPEHMIQQDGDRVGGVGGGGCSLHSKHMRARTTPQRMGFGAWTSPHGVHTLLCPWRCFPPDQDEQFHVMYRI